MLLPAEIIRRKRDGHALAPEALAAFARGLAEPDGPAGWSDAQAGAMAMAIVLRGMDSAEAVALTLAMRDSGQVLAWPDARGPVLDKHSTGGVGDKLSLMLAPMLAACGAVVPMVSGRGLGHTGGTLDKLEALPGYTVLPDEARLRRLLHDSGCAIVGAGPALAPADRRLYAIRDVTATVESVPLITASILSKKLAAGLQGLVLDVKVGSGAFATTPADAEALAHSLVHTACGAGLPTTALLSDMNQVLGHTAGNALETADAIGFLTGDTAREPRTLELTLALGSELLLTASLASDAADARRRLMQSLDSGAAAERFARMVAALGGPRDVLHDAQLATAPVQRDVPAPQAGVLQACDVRALGLAVVALGGGRLRPGDAVDPRVGLAGLRPLGATVAAGEALATVHAASDADAEGAIQALQAAFTIGTAPAVPAPLLLGRVAGTA
ncbi:thymidine phosphorylase [Pseudorhodoferax sp.]|uniref:thymidine phosphorylase n=1 Tax=Pseudorhodoferax sp. TaxID=1993553 RepID=UPI002DD68854|nr:thymidine phosphorylase [Pseudorhodoferax sp.]